MYNNLIKLGYGLSFRFDWKWGKECSMLVLTQVGIQVTPRQFGGQITDGENFIRYKGLYLKGIIKK